MISSICHTNWSGRDDRLKKTPFILAVTLCSIISLYISMYHLLFFTAARRLTMNCMYVGSILLYSM